MLNLSPLRDSHTDRMKYLKPRPQINGLANKGTYTGDKIHNKRERAQNDQGITRMLKTELMKLQLEKFLPDLFIDKILSFTVQTKIWTIATSFL